MRETLDSMFNRINSKSSIFTLLITSLWLMATSGCALSPQYVEINPAVEIKQTVSSNNNVAVTIVDQRPQAHLGTRGGVYSDTSYLHLSQPLSQSLTPVVISALERLGISTNNQTQQSVKLTLYVEELNYTMDDSKLPKTVTLKSRVRVHAVKGNQERESRFNSTKSHSFVTAPNDQENQKIINEIVSETLTRVFNDTELLQFIRQ